MARLPERDGGGDACITKINSLEEADRWPLHPCPECLAKLLWLTGAAPAEWQRGVLAFYEKHGLVEEAERTRHLLRSL